MTFGRKFYQVEFCNDTHAMEFLSPHEFVLTASPDVVARYSVLQRIYNFGDSKPKCRVSFLNSPTSTAAGILNSSSNATNNIDRFTGTLLYQQKQTMIISILLILFLLLILIYSLRKIFHIVRKQTSTGSLFNGNLFSFYF